METKKSANKFSITAAVLADRNYIVPALATCAGLKSYFQKTVLIFVSDPNSIQAIELLRDFLRRPAFFGIDVVVVNEFLPKFSHAHFNQSIVYKLLVPEIIGKGCDAIVLFDAGIVPSGNFNIYVDELNKVSEEILANGNIMGCYVHEINSPINIEVAAESKMKGWLLDNSYPSGGLLVFNNSSRRREVFEHLIQSYQRHISRLGYADQELIMLSFERFMVKKIATEGIILPLFLSLNFDSWESWNQRKLTDAAWWKVCGSVKPWKHWCLDPNRIYYLNELRKYFDDSLFSSYNPIIQDFFWSGNSEFLKVGAESFSKNINKFFNL